MIVAEQSDCFGTEIRLRRRGITAIRAGHTIQVRMAATSADAQWWWLAVRHQTRRSRATGRHTGWSTGDLGCGLLEHYDGPVSAEL